MRSAVNDAVADSAYLAVGAYDLGIALAKCIHKGIKSLGMCGHGAHCGIFSAVGCLVLDRTVLKTDLFAKSLCNDLFVVHINKLIFERRAAGIDYQYLHILHPFRSCRTLMLKLWAKPIKILSNGCQILFVHRIRHKL